MAQSIINCIKPSASEARMQGIKRRGGEIDRQTTREAEKIPCRIVP